MCRIPLPFLVQHLTGLTSSAGGMIWKIDDKNSSSGNAHLVLLVIIFLSPHTSLLLLFMIFKDSDETSMRFTKKLLKQPLPEISFNDDGVSNDESNSDNDDDIVSVSSSEDGTLYRPLLLK